ncbi:hypothetical protein PR048_016519 [Dryococelus australis]|uniref:Uncharacterized protein n=1 Tax=Dryococelus australis TaxID=614101 RepID=A0ABQ9HKI6_9NEOP|nr:hypothetical protein PR048_016519 [Dryococelus australis]
MEEFNAQDVGELQCFIGTELPIAEDRIELSQHKLIDKMLMRFNLEECKGSPFPMEDRPDISEADAVIDVPYRELGTSDQKYIDECSQEITFADGDWVSDKTDCKSVSGTASFHWGNLVSWSSKKQPIVALSSAEAEYTSCSVAASDHLYLKGLLSEFVGKTMGVKCCLMVDNQEAIHIVKKL